MRHTNVEKNYYAVLGLTEDVSQEEIVRIYKRLANQYHPDRGGSAEDMKAINEAYRVLGNEATRRAYDLRRRKIGHKAVNATAPPLSVPLAIFPDTTFGRFLEPLFILFGGLFFLFFVSINYLRFMWPLLLFSIIVSLFGVWKLHVAIDWARKKVGPTHALRRNVWAQESAFWLLACVGAYVTYRLISAM